MPDVTVKKLEDFEAVFGGGMVRVRAGLGVTSFGMQVIQLPPGFEMYPEHDHLHDEQEEVYTVLEGSATLEGSRLGIWQPSREEESLSTPDLEYLPESRAIEPLGAAHRRQLKEIFAALREGREPPVAGEEARKAVEIVLGIYRSASLTMKRNMTDGSRIVL